MKSKKDQPDKPGMSVEKGGHSPGSLNPQLRRQTKRTFAAEEYIDGIRSGDRLMLSRAITLIESTRPDHQEIARAVVEACLPLRVASVRIGVTGAPGVGKSTFIEALGLHLLGQGKRPAVIAVDPSSEISRGSILGDKTRMEKLGASENAFIRPSPAAGSLGGVAGTTREVIFLCEAARFDTIIVETVGVGQSETAVHSMVDFFLLLLLPGAGDELQGIKRGIVEMADLIAVNKADGERLSSAKRTRSDYQNALHLFPPKSSGWTPQAVICSSLENSGIAGIWTTIESFHRLTTENAYFMHNRQEQARHWMYQHIDKQLKRLLFEKEEVRTKLPAIEKAVMAGEISSIGGALVILRFLFPE